VSAWAGLTVYCFKLLSITVQSQVTRKYTLVTHFHGKLIEKTKLFVFFKRTITQAQVFS